MLQVMKSHMLFKEHFTGMTADADTELRDADSCHLCQ